ncbi:MAG: CDP-alcohol phosphatidyltransferase family protein [Actinomycetes bacterium]
MNDLYALKPRFADTLTGVRRWCISTGVRPTQLTWLGVAAGTLAGATVASRSAGLLTALLVTVFLVARLGCANLDGGVARETQATTPWGAVENELGDRLADLAMLVGLVLASAATSDSFAIPVGAGLDLGCLMLLAATLPSWVALAVTAAGGSRVNGGVMGKTERCAVVVVGALTGWYLVAIAVITVGSTWTALARLQIGARELATAKGNMGGAL